MTAFGYLINKRFLFIFLLLILTILSIVSAIYIMDAKKITTSKKTTNLIGYQNLKQEIEAAGKIDKISNNRNFNTLLKKIADLETKNLTKDEQLSQIKFAWTDLYSAYLDTNDPELYKLSLEFKKFAETNFTDKNFKIIIQCLDPTCAEQPIPNEILAIIDEIDNSNISAEIKNDYSHQLKIFSYVNDKDSTVKVVDYLSLAVSMAKDEEFTKAGINLKIYNEIRNYVKKAFPELYDKYSNNISLENT